MTGCVISYRVAHKHVTRARGQAFQHRCCTCGDRAAEWAYDHKDPNELSQQWYGKTVTYSLDPAHYRPMCRSCHNRKDKGSQMWNRNTLAAIADQVAPSRAGHRRLRQALAQLGVDISERDARAVAKQRQHPEQLTGDPTPRPSRTNWSR